MAAYSESDPESSESDFSETEFLDSDSESELLESGLSDLEFAGSELLELSLSELESAWLELLKLSESESSGSELSELLELKFAELEFVELELMELELELMELELELRESEFLESEFVGSGLSELSELELESSKMPIWARALRRRSSWVRSRIARTRSASRKRVPWGGIVWLQRYPCDRRPII